MEAPSILIIDASYEQSAVGQLLDPEFAVAIAHELEEARSIILSQSSIKLIYINLLSGDVDSVGFMSWLRGSSEANLRDMHIIVIGDTGMDQSEIIKFSEYGVTQIITPPFDRDLVTAQAKEILGGSNSGSHGQSTPIKDAETILDEERFTTVLWKELSYAIRHKNELALLLLKLDQFELITEQGGLQAMESLLTTCAEIIQKHTRHEDMLAYFGDGVFAILVPATNAISTKYLGKRILHELQTLQFSFGDGDEPLTVSIGVSAPDIKQHTTIEDILKPAKKRLKLAFEEGGSQVIDNDSHFVSEHEYSGISEPLETDAESPFHLKKEMHAFAEKDIEHLQHAKGSVSTPPEIAADQLERLALLEKENTEQKEEITRLKLETENNQELKKQLQEIEDFKQKNNLKLKQLSEKINQIRTQAEAAKKTTESNLEVDGKPDLYEQNLLEEIKLLQKQLIDEKQTNVQVRNDLKHAEWLMTKLKRQHQAQLEELQTQLTQERANMLVRSENSHPTTQQSEQTQINPFDLTSIPVLKSPEKPRQATAPTFNITQQAPTRQQSAQPVKVMHLTRVGTPSSTTKSKANTKSRRLPSFIWILIIGFTAAIGILMVGDHLLSQHKDQKVGAPTSIELNATSPKK